HDFQEKVRRHLEQYLASFRSVTDTGGGRIHFSPPNIPLPGRAGIRSAKFRQAAVAREHRFAVRAIAFSPDDRLLVSGDREGVIRTWTLEQLSEGLLVPKSVQVAHRASVRRLVFSDDGRLIASVGDDDTFKAWLLGAEVEVSEILEASGLRLSLWAFEPEGRLIVTSGKTGLRLMNPVAWSVEKTWGHEFPPAREFTFSPDGLLLAAAYDNGALVVWDMRLFSVQYTLRADGPLVNCLHFSPDSRLVASCGRESSVSVWSARTGELAAKLELPGDDVQSVTFSHDGKLLVAGDWDGRIVVWQR
ncbi:MAG: WD40 repeat domain-containing protein, partial [Bryobacteraceae bacterium]